MKQRQHQSRQIIHIKYKNQIAGGGVTYICPGRMPWYGSLPRAWRSRISSVTRSWPLPGWLCGWYFGLGVDIPAVCMGMCGQEIYTGRCSE